MALVADASSGAADEMHRRRRAESQSLYGALTLELPCTAETFQI